MAENYISIHEDNGSIYISEDVLSSIIRSSILEVEGIGSILNLNSTEIAEFVGIKPALKGIKITNDDDNVIVDAVITVKYGFNIVDIAQKVQNSIQSHLLSILGLYCIININVSGISFL